MVAIKLFFLKFSYFVCTSYATRANYRFVFVDVVISPICDEMKEIAGAHLETGHGCIICEYIQTRTEASR